VDPALDPYAVLGVDLGADRAAIRAAYRRLARAHHPDVDGGSDAAMARLNEAWAMLSNPEARAAYHQERGLPPAGSVVPPAPSAPAPTAARERSAPASTVLDFGRYAGWSLRDLAREDPAYLRWLERTPIGRRFQAEIAKFLPSTPVGSFTPQGSPGLPRWRRVRR